MRKTLIPSLFVFFAGACAAFAQSPAAAPAEAKPANRQTFGNWTVTCAVTPGSDARSCEANVSLQPETQLPPVARIGFVREGKDKPVRLVAIVQANLSLLPGVEIAIDPDKAKAALTFKSCLNTACLADVMLSEEQLAAFRSADRNGRMTIVNAGGEPLSVGFPSAGLLQAIDALTPAGQ